MKVKKPNPQILDIDGLCALMGVETLSSKVENNVFSNDELYGFVYREHLSTGATEEQADQAALDAENEEESAACEQYMQAVLFVANKLFEEHHLFLEEVKSKKGFASTYKVIPKISWKDSAAELIKTINGVGMFEFDSVKEFCNSTPATPKATVLTHLHWVKDWVEVYEGGKASHMVERRLRSH